MKAIQLTVRNIKRISAVELDLNPGLTVVGGNNTQGKSSLLDSLTMAIAGERFVPKTALKNGAEFGEIVVKTDGLNIRTIKREFDENGKTRLKTYDAEGNLLPRGQSLLQELYDGPRPDVTAFLTMSAKDQAAKVRQILGIDTSELDTRREKLFKTRTDVNRDADDFEGSMLRMPFYPEAPESDVSVDGLMDELEKAQARNAEIFDAERTAEGYSKILADQKAKILRLKDEYQQAVDQYKVLEADSVKASEKLEELKPLAVDVVPIKEQLRDIGAVNQKVAANRERQKIEEKFRGAKAESVRLTQEIAAIDKAKFDMLAAVKFPVPGLGIDGDVVTLNGLPLDQASSREKLTVGILLYIATNPELRCVPVYEGSYFDSESLAMLAEICDEHNCQVILERVGEGDECDVVIEDGKVKGGVK